MRKIITNIMRRAVAIAGLTVACNLSVNISELGNEKQLQRAAGSVTGILPCATCEVETENSVR